MRPALALIPFVFMTLSAGFACKHGSSNDAAEDWKTRVPPLIGKPDADVLAEFGSPTSRQYQGSVEVWVYEFPYEEQTGFSAMSQDTFAPPSERDQAIGSTADPTVKQPRVSVGHKKTLRLYISDGKLAGWDSEVK